MAACAKFDPRKILRIEFLALDWIMRFIWKNTVAEIEVSNVIQGMVTAKFSKTEKIFHGDPRFHGRVPNIK